METSYSEQMYINEFDPVVYYQTYYSAGKGGIATEWTDFALQNLHEIFCSGVKGDILIDFGAGPGFYHLFSSCEVFNSIITSDFLEQNREQLEKWLKKDPAALDWSHFAKYVCELEGNRDNWEKKEETLRRKITKVLKCDALADKPFDVPMPEADCLISCLCLENVCQDREAFINVLQKLKELLKPGGHIIIQSILNCSYYHIGNSCFSHLPLSKDDVEKSFKEAGYEIVKIKVLARSVKSEMEVSDSDGYYCIHARKPHKE
ncbi:nicotinamide N-methyltransferase-like [Bufo gargarizans]|uniref:nicotinamide N-methyltransferase-like n=1 Tax=Bufo gargarizans TaxID=30331 RepID=UPI001CF5E9B7|nr:nicotinamide N-methyltransferase-like [Bufo gargarizans]